MEVKPSMTKTSAIPVATRYHPAATVADDDIRNNDGGGGGGGGGEEEDPNGGVDGLRRPRSHRHGPRYIGGFSSSICDLFNDHSRRSDCCAVVCGGVLASDRNQHLLKSSTGATIEPIRWRRRFYINVFPFLVIIIFRSSITGGVYETEEDAESAAAIANLLSLVAIIYFIFLVIRTHKIRNHRRQELIRKLYELDNAENPSSAATQQQQPTNPDLIIKHASDQSRCAHFPCFGCVNNDQIGNDISNAAFRNHDEEEDKSDFCNCLFQFAASICCASCCQCWLQIFGICALAQETRELNALVPKEKRLIDYITQQPFAEYFPSIENLRLTKDESLASHIRALSQLSKILCKRFLLIFLALFLLALTKFEEHFSLKNLVIIVLTFFQAFLVMYFVHWRWHKFDLSIDAVIKYFVCGFVIIAPTSALIEYFVSSFFSIPQTLILTFEIMTDLEDKNDDNYGLDDLTTNEIVVDEITKHEFTFLLFDFLNAFVTYALVEELAKYFGYWMLEHPDLLPEISLTRNEPTSSSPPSSQSENVDAFSNDEEQTAVAASPSPPKDPVSLGAGVTIAMVSVAMGFACCENLLYVLSLTNPDNFKSEFKLLLLRSIIPVHPIAAAIQSVGVCQRDIEGEKSVKLGQIVLPAIIVHGLYDFAVIGMQFIEVLQKWGRDGLPAEDDFATEGEDDGFDPKTTLPAFALGMVCALVGAFYYFAISRSQCTRLSQLQSVGGTAVDGRTLL